MTAILNTLCHWSIFWTMPLAGRLRLFFACCGPAHHPSRAAIICRSHHRHYQEIQRIALINDVFGLTGGSNGIFGISRPRFFGYKIVKSVQFYYLVWGMVGVSLLLFYGLWRSRFGRALNYIKEDDVAAEGCEVNVTRYKLLAFVLGAFWAGMAGTVYAAKMVTIAPESFNFMESAGSPFAVVILSLAAANWACWSALSVHRLPGAARVFRPRPPIFSVWLGDGDERSGGR